MDRSDNFIVGLGEALWDVLPDGKKLGGAPANFAYHTSQFGFNSMAVSAVGDDRLGDETLAALDSRGLAYSMARVPYPTGTVTVTLDANGIPAYDIRENVAWDNIPFTPELADVAANCRAVCWGSLAQRNVVSRETINRFLDAMPDGGGRLKIFDVNLRQHFYSAEVLSDSFRRCNVLKINDEELVAIGRLFGYPGLDMQGKCRLMLGKYNLDVLCLPVASTAAMCLRLGMCRFRPRRAWRWLTLWGPATRLRGRSAPPCCAAWLWKRPTRWLWMYRHMCALKAELCRSCRRR